MLPDGVGAFGQILDTGIVGSLALITGALPAQYGLRTAGVLDIQTKTDAFNNSGSVSVYGGSHGTITPSFEYGGTVGQTQYFVSGRYFGSNLGIENPTPSNEAIHDRTAQEKGFLYLSTVIDPTSRLTFMSGVSNGTYQIPNNPGQTPNFTAFGVSNFNSALPQRASERVQPVQRARLPEIGRRHRFSDLLFQPLQPVALLLPIRSAIWSSTASRRTSTVRASSTAFRKIPPGASAYAHTLRFGFSVSAERSLVNNISTVLPLADPQRSDPTGNPIDAPFSDLRFKQQDRLADRHLSSGRVEDHQPI